MNSDKQKVSVAHVQQSADSPAAASVREDGHAMRATTAHEPPQDNQNKIEHSLPWVPWVAEQDMQLNAASPGRPRRSSLYAGSARRGVDVPPPTHTRRLSAQDDQLTAETAEPWQHTTPLPSSKLIMTAAAQKPATGHAMKMRRASHKKPKVKFFAMMMIGSRAAPKQSKWKCRPFEEI